MSPNIVRKKRPAFIKNPIGVGTPALSVKEMNLPRYVCRILNVSGFANTKNTRAL